MHRGLVSLLFLFFFGSRCNAASSTAVPRDPYKTLGVQRDATQEAIRSRYRELCLKYHPDKNTGKSAKQQQRCTELFKRIQAANSLIGDPQSRRSYNLQSSFFGRPTTDARYNHNNKSRQSTTRSAEYASSQQDSRAFGANGSVHRNPRYDEDWRQKESEQLVFECSRQNNIFRTMIPPIFESSPLKSIYEQTVKVSLQDLYRGRSNLQINIRDSLWKSYRAAFRGGLGFLLLCQSGLLSTPLLYLFGGRVRLAFLVLLFHVCIPRLETVKFTVDTMPPGCKDGTRFVFRELGTGFEVVFVVEEKPHQRFVRKGNNLHTSVDIQASQAKKGCTVEVESLDPTGEPPTTAKVRPNEVKRSGDTITVYQGGWPDPKTGEKGDLIIHFRLV